MRSSLEGSMRSSIKGSLKGSIKGSLCIVLVISVFMPIFVSFKSSIVYGKLDRDSKIKFPLLEGKTATNKPFVFRANNGKPTLIFLWSMSCALCLKQMKEIQEISEKHTKEKLTVIMFNLDGVNAEKAKEHFRVKKFTTKNVFKVKQGFFHKLRAVMGVPILTIPYYILLDKKGEMVYSLERTSRWKVKINSYIKELL